MKRLEHISRLPDWMAGLLGLVLIALIAGLNSLAGPQFGCSPFYLLPILLVTWSVGRVAGLLISVAAAGAWLLIDLTARERYAHVFFPYWNAMARMGIFWVIVMVVSVFKSERLLSRTDSLTRIANRQAFFEQATLEIERCRRYGRALSVAYLDCDDFKKVNDQRGHLAGDALLRSVADCLKNNVRGADLVARLGGDEFALLLPETGIAAARGVLEKVQVLLQMTLETGGWPTSFSIGSVTFLEPPRSVDQMIQRADELMYEVKRSGKNGVRLQVIGSSRTDPQPLIGSSTRSRL